MSLPADLFQANSVESSRERGGDSEDSAGFQQDASGYGSVASDMGISWSGI